MEKLKIQVIYQEATVDSIKNGDFDAVIVAAGGVPIKLDVPGEDRSMVSHALEILGGKCQVGKRVVVVGGGVVGTETGLFLAEQGKETIFVEALDKFMNDVGHVDQMCISSDWPSKSFYSYRQESRSNLGQRSDHGRSIWKA
jgi:pyruvate/2-oxoglutarate dehydrogenase complex dihydrolipoamide dehydrogenase (E3) component